MYVIAIVMKEFSVSKEMAFTISQDEIHKLLDNNPNIVKRPNVSPYEFEVVHFNGSMYALYRIKCEWEESPKAEVN